MATVDSLFDSADYKPSKAEILRGFVTDKLSSAAQEILAVVERTVAGYEEEAAGLRQEIERQRSHLESLLQPRVTLCRIDDQIPVYELVAVGGGGGAEEEEEHKHEPNMEDSGSRNILGHAEEEEEGEDEGEPVEEPVRSTGPDQEDLRDPDHQIPNTRFKYDVINTQDNTEGLLDRGQRVKRKYTKRWPLHLRVGLLKDSHTDLLKKGALKSRMKDLRCPRGLQESDFLNLLRSTFPQLTAQFDVFTTDGTKRLTPLKVQTLTPEEIERSIRCTGNGRSALYIRAKRAEKSLTSTEQLPPPQRKDEATSDTRSDENSSHVSSLENVERNKADRLSMETKEDGEQHGIPDDFGALSSVHSAAESEGDDGDDDDDEVQEGDKDDEWKPDKNDEELRESKAELKSLKTTRKRQVKHSGVKTKRRKRLQSSLKASTDGGGAPLSCKVCKTLRSSMRMLIKHSWSHVDDPERLCGVCGERSESAEELRSHLQSHQKIHSCNICGKSFLYGYTLDRHVTLHTGERPYKCDICSKTYRCEGSLKAHRWEHVEDKPHKCDVCVKSFAFKQQLMIHSRTHTGEKPHRCDVCDKSFGDLRSLSRHKLCHVGEKRYSCEVCGKCFLTPDNLKQHERIHTDREKLFLCEICCRGFAMHSQLRAHLKTHNDEKVTCSECGKELSSQGSLSTHMLIHTGEKKYECSECGRRFSTKSILNSHLKTHSGVRQFVCVLCGKSCARKDHLKVHMRTHNGEKPYECNICSKAFTQSHCLKTHMKSHQREEKSAVDGLKS